MKILFYEVRHFSPNFQKKILVQKLETKKMSKSVSGYYKTKKKIIKKWHVHWCREGKTLVVRPL